MDIIFVLHGEAAHQHQGRELRHRIDPPLTERGKRTAVKMRESEPLNETDAVVAGPVFCMLQTADLWTKGTACSRYVHPLAGPRQHPFRYDFQTPPCDRPMEPERIAAAFPELLLPAHLPEHLWLQGIHTLPGILFAQHAERFLAWCRGLEKSRVFVVTGEGTLRAFRAHVSASAESGTDGGKESRIQRWILPRSV